MSLIRCPYDALIPDTLHQIDRLAATQAADLPHRPVYLADNEPIKLKPWACLIQRELRACQIHKAQRFALRLAALLGDLVKAAPVRGFPTNSFQPNNLLTYTVLSRLPMKLAVGALPHDLPVAVAITRRRIQSKESLR